MQIFLLYILYTKMSANKGTKNSIVVDLKEHILGRSAAIIARELLDGRHVIATKVEKLEMAGPELRNKRKFLDFLRKKHITNPKKGPFHFRSPRMMFHRVVRGMLPKGKRGQAALARLKIYEGVPEFINARRLCLPGCLRPTRFTPHRKHTVLGDISKQVGWTSAGIVEEYEARRQEKQTSIATIAAQKEESERVKLAAAESRMSKDDLNILQKFGYALN